MLVTGESFGSVPPEGRRASRTQEIINLNRNISQEYPTLGQITPSIKLPLTMVGNVALSKGMYLTLMKRREQKTFGCTSYSSTPRLRTNQYYMLPNKQYSSCARINQSSNKRNTTPTPIHHNFNAGKRSQSHKRNQKDKVYLDEGMNSSRIQQRQYKEIHKTKKISKENNEKPMTRMRASRDALLNDITGSCLNRKENRGEQKCLSSFTKGNIGGSGIVGGGSSRGQMSSMRERSKMYSSQIKGSQKSRTTTIASRVRDDKENEENNPQMSEQENCKRRGFNEINPYGLKELKYSSIWHEEAIDMQTERAMFIQKIRKDEKKKYSQSPKRCVPGFRVKFETSKSRIFAFNCFRDKDLSIDKTYRNTIDLQQDNDFDTDCEQLKESIYNVFQSLCVAVCEEKINAQLSTQTKSNIY